MVADRPVALLDSNRCRKNIQRMAGKIKQLGLAYRPHFKTHQSAEIGSWYQEAGITAITVSSPGMASYFINNGWNDITIAFPSTRAQFPVIQELSAKAELKIFLNDIDSARYYSENCTAELDVYIEIDAGFGRSGVEATGYEKIDRLISIIQNSGSLKFYGFYVHDGRTYQAKGRKAVHQIIQPVLEKLQALKAIYPDAKICIGDTPSASLLETFPGADELSPGNNVFYDLMQSGIGSCAVEQIAVAVACPVVQVKPESGQAIIHGGAVHFSKEHLSWGSHDIYGAVANVGNGNLGDLAGSYLTGLAQEHGTVKGDAEWISGLKAGDTIYIFPVHSCLTVNQFDHYQTLGGDRIEKRILS